MRGISGLSFALVDEQGHAGATISWEAGQPTIRLFDRDSHVRSALFLEPNGVPDLYLYDQNQKVRAALNLFDSGVPNLAFLDPTEQQMVWTEYDADRSYNLKFATIGKEANTIVANRRIKAGKLGLQIDDRVTKSQ